MSSTARLGANSVDDLIVDAGTLFAQADADDPEHEAVVALFEGERGPLVTSQLAVAEADHLTLSRLGVGVEIAFLDDLAAGTFVVDCLDRKELGLARDLAHRYRDLELSLCRCRARRSCGGG